MSGNLLDFGSNGNSTNLFGNMFNNTNSAGLKLGGGTGQQSGSFLDFFNSENLNNLGTGIDAIGSLFDMYQGMKSLKLGEKTYDLNKDNMTTNLANQSKLTNERLSTRQASRLRSQGLSGDAVTNGVADFMAKYGVSGTLGS